MKFAFDRGNWENQNSLPEWNPSEEFEDFLTRIGYSSVATTFGHEHGGQIAIYESKDGDSFYASVCPLGSTVYEVFLPDFPSLMMFLRDYSVAFSAESSNAAHNETLSVLEKLFRVYHGHAAYDVCKQCDPTEWDRRLEAMDHNRKVRSGKGQGRS
jgi:hypothetical protein